MRTRLSESNTDLKVQILAQEAANSAVIRELEAMKQRLKHFYGLKDEAKVV
ncbi:hypothetical protein HOY82DRAFT_602413 [Tuber indicum]|nr:hypothetical protein HOY82DRAFT_602413 [Tuber indicum]